MNKHIKLILVSAFTVAISSCVSVQRVTPPAGPLAATAASDDPYLWLEDSKNPKTMQWVAEHNSKSSRALQGTPKYTALAAEIRAIVTSKDRIPDPDIEGSKVRNFWQDQSHQRGIWRQTTLSDYRLPHPNWETILDIDELNRKESKSWVFKHATCLPPAADLCLISLSEGGRDEVVVREFQVSKRSFVHGGFEVPTAKTEISYFDHDTVFLGTDFGPDSLTDSGYPREVRIWKRGTPISAATVIFKGDKGDVSSVGFRSFRSDSKLAFIHQGVNYFKENIFVFDGPKALKLKVPFPSTSEFKGEFGGQLLAWLRQDWTTPERTYLTGTIVSLPIGAITDKDFTKKIETVYTPDAQSALQSMELAHDYMLLATLTKVRGKLLQIKRNNGKWISKSVVLPDQGQIKIVSTNDFSNHAFVSYQSFDVPTTLYYSNGENLEKSFRKIKSLPPQYDAADIVVEQFQVASKDGTKIPYFMIHKKNLVQDGSHPTLLYGYGGFEISLVPQYSGVVGKAWLEKGGVYAVANIRGGGEFGPSWHTAALKENRQRAYDDFEGVAEDLIARKVTSPAHLGIKGGSNGGLLVGVALTQRPDLFGAVICESALLDMLRYTQLPPGASWIAEYGDPADPQARAFISKYSPYQNIKSGVTYPETFFHISTADDRVQPGHTRKMAARLEENGHSVLLYENTEGGHSGSAEPEQLVTKSALEFSYLYSKLF